MHANSSLLFSFFAIILRTRSNHPTPNIRSNHPVRPNQLPPAATSPPTLVDPTPSATNPLRTRPFHLSHYSDASVSREQRGVRAASARRRAGGRRQARASAAQQAQDRWIGGSRPARQRRDCRPGRELRQVRRPPTGVHVGSLVCRASSDGCRDGGFRDASGIPSASSRLLSSLPISGSCFSIICFRYGRL